MKESLRSYQVGWYGIDLQDAGKLSVLRRPNGGWYANFYKLLFKKYAFYEQIDNNLIGGKVYTKDLIKDKINLYKAKKVLSFACGTSYIEYLLLKDKAINPEDLFMYDWSNNSFEIFDKYGFKTQKIVGDFQDSKSILKEIDMVYFIQLLYSFNLSEMRDFFKLFREYGKPDCKYLTTYTTNTNFKQYSPGSLLLKKMFAFLYPIYSYYIRRRQAQLLGWERSTACYESILKENNAQILESGQLTSGEKYFVFSFKK